MPHRILLPLIAVVVLLAGCVPSRPDIDPDTGAGLVESAAWFERLSADEQLKVAAKQDAESERELWQVAGLDDALGGEEAADEAFAAMQHGLAGRLDDLRNEDAGTFAPASFGTGGGDDFTSALGGGMFANMLLGDTMAQLGIDATKDGKEGSDSKDFGDDAQATVDSHGGTVTTGFETKTQYKGVDLTLKVKNQITPCPDPDGMVHSEGTYTLVASAPDGHGLITEVSVKDDIQVGDDAQKVDSKYSYYVEYSDNSTGDGIIAYGVDANGRTSVGNGWWASAGGVKNAFANGSFFSAWISGSLERAAQKGWESGRCIQLNVSYSDGPGGLEPNDKVTLTVSPIAKSDGAPAGGTVTAKLTSGTKSVSPSGEKVKADATFTYTAPGERDKDGTVHLEARSKRGVGLLDITLDTKAAAYTLTGGGGEVSMSGRTCDIGKPFSVSGTGLTMAFTPSSSSGGTFTLSGAIGVPWSGSGTYTVSTTPGGGTLTATGDYTVHSPLADFTKPGVFTYTLTPLQDCK